MTESFADVLVGAVKDFHNRITTLEKSFNSQKAQLQKLHKDVEEIQSNMELVAQYISSKA